jgi:predicted nucleotidyltransferase
MPCMPPKWATGCSPACGSPVAPLSRDISLATDIAAFLSGVADWAQAEPGIVAVALVGSFARGSARPDSDIDLVLLCQSPQTYLDDRSWIEHFGTPVRQTVEEWGRVTSLRVWYAHGTEVEYGLAPANWAADPADQGDAQVLSGGIRVLFDRDGTLSRRLQAIGARGRS